MTCVAQNEQLDIGISFCNIGKGIAETRYFDSQFLNRLNADEPYWRYFAIQSKNDILQLLQLSMDSPSVNWSALHKFESKLDDQGQQETMISDVYLKQIDTEISL